MTFERESFSAALVDEMRPLLDKHYQETSSKNYSRVNPAVHIYRAVDETGNLRIYTARIKSRLIGYQVFVVHANPHAMQSIDASQDVLFLDAAYRKGIVGLKFMKWCIAQLSAEGVDMIHQKVCVRTGAGKLLERMGFTLEDLSYSLRLKEEC